MPALYVSSQLRAKAAQNPAYTERGLSNLTTGRLEECHTVGLPDIQQTAYPNYVANLSAFLAATSIQRKVTCGSTYELRLDPTKVIPLPLPPLTLAPLKPFTKDEEEVAYLKAFGAYEVLTQTYNKRKVYTVTTPTPEGLLIYPRSDLYVPSAPDCTSLSGMIQFMTTLKVLTLFLATHSYPAYQAQDDDGNKIATDMDYHIDTVNKSVAGPRGDQRAYSKIKFARKFWSESAAGPEEYDDYPTENTLSGNGAVFVAKPAPFYPAINYGPPSAIPNLPGFCLPYFHGMILPSRDSLITIMRRYFLNTFGKDEETKAEKWKVWVQGVDKWYKTSAGMIISHVFYCLQATLEAQGRLFVVLSEGSYIGSVILGFKFRLYHNGMILDADTSLEVRRHAAASDKHSLALHGITEILRKMAVSGSEDIDTDLEITSARQLHREICSREQLRGDDLEELVGMVKDLAFTQRYWHVSADTVAKAVRTIYTPDATIEEEWPMYLDPTSVYDDSRIYQVLSVFGPTAPSFLDAGGQFVQIPRGLDDTDPQSSIPSNETIIRMPTIFITSKKSSVACNDMRSVQKNRRIRQNPNERAGGFRTIAVKGPGRDAVWNALKLIPWDVPEGGKKRKATDLEEDGEGREKRTKKSGRDMVEGNFAELF